MTVDAPSIAQNAELGSWEAQLGRSSLGTWLSAVASVGLAHIR